MADQKKALVLASVASMIDQFNMENIRILQELGYTVDVVADFVDGGTITPERVEDLKSRLQKMSVNYYHVPIPRQIRNIKRILKSSFFVKKLCEEKQYQIVHCQSPIGGVITRLAARKARKKGTKVVYTAHGFHFYEGAPKKNWILFYPIEKLCSRYTDVLITINQEDYELAKEKFHAAQVVYLPGVGVDMEKFESGSTDIEQKRIELGISPEDILLLSVGELSERKNHEVVIRALHELNRADVKYCIVGKGPLEQHLKQLVFSLDMTDRVMLPGYRTDVPGLCQSSDLFVFPSHQEGLPMALMEAMASSTPVICSRIRGNKDLITDQEIMFDEHSKNDVKRCLEAVLGNRSRQEVAEHMSVSVSRNCEQLKNFDVAIVNAKMRDIYGQIS